MNSGAVVLSAGFGTRLAPITEEIPKPLVPVGDRPLLMHTLEKLHQVFTGQLAVNAHYKFLEIVNCLDGLPFKVEVCHEPRILGTAGGLRHASWVLGCDEMLVVNGDIWGLPPIEPLRRLRAPGLVLAVGPAAPGQGTVGIGVTGQVVRLRGQVFGEEVRSGNYMGVAHAGPQCLAELPREGCLVGDYALPLLRRGGTVTVYECSSRFIDVGSKGAYLDANLCWLTSKQRRPELPCLRSYLGRGALRGRDVVCCRSVVGEAARVMGRGELAECVVFPGALARAPLRRAVVLPSGRVVQVDPE